MRGNINWQVQEIFKKSGINQIGQSKHQAKESAKEHLDSHNITHTWHSIGKKIGIYSYRTADLYRDIWKQLGKHVKTRFKVKDFEQIRGEHIRSYLGSKLEKGVSHSTFLQYAAALEKLETALNGFAEFKESGIRYEFSDDIKEMRSKAHKTLERFTGTRGYEDPDALVHAISNPVMQLVAKIQLESGCRVAECTFLCADNLKGIQEDPVTGEEKGVIYVEKAKGGKSGNKYMNRDTYNELEHRINNSGNKRFVVNYQNYRYSLKRAAKLTGQNYTGSHGLRWNFAQNRFHEVQVEGGCTYTQALYQVSEELFHERANITKHYLRM